MITPNQIAAGRSYLRMSQEQLAEKAGFKKLTILKAEKGEVHVDTVHKIEETLESLGIEFINGGIREKQELSIVLEGQDGIRKFYNDVADTAETQGGEFLVYAVGQKELMDKIQKNKAYGAYRDRVAKAENTKLLVLIGNDDKKSYQADYLTFKYLPHDSSYVAMAYFVYGSKVAFFIQEQISKIVVINNDSFTTLFKRQFYRDWKTATRLESEGHG